MDPGAGPSHSVSEFYAALALEWKPFLTSSCGAFFSASCKSQQSIKKLHNEICKSITQFLKCYCANACASLIFVVVVDFSLT